MFAYCGNNPVVFKDSTGTFRTYNVMMADGGRQTAPNKALLLFRETENLSTNINISGQFQSGIFRGSGSITSDYSQDSSRWQGDKKLSGQGKGSSVVGLFSKNSALNASGEIGIGSDDISLSLKGVFDVLTISTQGGFKYQDEYGMAAKAKAAAYAGRVTLELEVFDWRIEVGVTGDALSIGAGLTFGFFSDGFVFEPRASLGIGGGFVFRVDRVN